MKKMLALIIGICLGITAQVFAANISLPNLDASEDGAIEIPVVVDDAARIAGFQFTVNYDSSVLQATGVSEGDLTAGWMVKTNTNESGQIKVAGFSTSLQELSFGSSGSLAKLQFKVVGKPGKKNALSFTVCSLSDSEGKKIASTCKEGQIKIKGPKKTK